jgi:hypothetical protein
MHPPPELVGVELPKKSVQLEMYAPFPPNPYTKSKIGDSAKLSFIRALFISVG